MVGMEVRQEHLVDSPKRNPKLRHADDRAAPAIQQYTLRSGLDNGRRAKGIDIRIGNACSKENDPQNIVGLLHDLFPLIVATSMNNSVRTGKGHPHRGWPVT